MHTLETILCALALMACLGLLAEPILSHQAKLTQAKNAMESRYEALQCSAEWDYALASFVQTTTGGCSDYSYALHANGNPFTTLMGGDSNHYE